MKSLRSLLVAAAIVAMAILGRGAEAQTAPCQGVNITTFTGTGNGMVCANTEGQKASYRAAFVGLVPPSSATDMVCIAGSATKTIRVTRISLAGTAGTLVSLPIWINVHTSADTGGTAASAGANPANTKTALDQNDAVPTATLVSYTAVPTIGDTTKRYVAATELTLPVTSAGTVIVPAEFKFGTMNARALVLRGAAQQACVNFNSVSVSTGLVNGDIEWTEE